MADFFKQNTKVTVTKTTIDMKIFTDIDAGDYRLKTLRLPSAALDEQPDQSIRRLGSPIRFSVETLCAAIQKKCTFDTIKWYLQSYEDSYGFKETAAQDGWPALYYAVERNSPGLLSILLQNGINPHKWYKGFPLPVIAFAIVHGHHEAVDTTGVVRLLLAFGVDPKVIPMDIWQNFLQSPKATGLSVWKFLDIATQLVDTDISWCTPEVRPRLAASLHLSHRYLLHLAHKLKKPNTRTLQISKANKMTDLGKLPYFLIGQQPAANLVMSNVYSYIAIGESKPMVMAFAGPSGHGKTELARALGDLLSVQTTVVDCASVTTVWGLFGPTAGWIGYENGSQLNNFLADNDSQRSVVFLDEFDKTEQKIRDALLLMTEKGEYTDRRFNRAIDCSKTIWVIATNVGSDRITGYYTKHLEKLSEEKRDKADMRPLQAELKRIYRNEFGAPFTGRVSLFVPFLPFSKPERAVVLHKFVLKLATRVREPIDLRPGIQNLIGHCRLTLVDDGQVCTTLSEQYYNKDLGARSLENAVANLKQEFTAEYSMMDGEITEDLNDGPLQEFLVRRIPVGDDEYEVRVYAASSNLGFDEEDDVGAGADDRSDLRDGDEEGIKGESSLGKSIDVGSKKKKNKATKK